MNHSGLHITTNFHVMRKWIESRKGVPCKVKVGKKSYPSVSLEDSGSHHQSPVSWPEFFALMLKHDLAFLYESDHEDNSPALFFKFVPRENYLDDLRQEELDEDYNLVRDLGRAFS